MYVALLLGVILGASVIAAFMLAFALAFAAKRADEWREEDEAQVKAEHLAEAKQQVEDFLAEATREQAMTFSRMQAEAYESDVARLAAMN